MTSQTINGATTAMSYNNSANELSSAGSKTYGYDANGNETSASGLANLAYNPLNQTMGLSGPAGAGMSGGYAGSSQSQRVSAGNLAYQSDATGVSSVAASSLQTTGNSLSAAYTTSDQPVSVAAGGTATYKVTVTNTGTSTWPAGGSNPVHLGIHFASQGGGYAANSATWSTDQRYSLPNDVAPGQATTLTVTVNPPTTTGSYTLEAQMVQEYVAWFGQYLDSSVTVSTGGLAASCRTSGQPSSLSSGGSAPYNVTATNNGTSTWPAGGANPVHLGIHFAKQGGGYSTGSSTWSTDQRYSLPSDVGPGQSVTLSVTITAPGAGGSYVLEYQMVQEGIVWFPEYQDSAMTVGSTPPSPSGTTYFTRTPDGRLLSERTSSGTYYYLFDGTGSVVGLTNSSGTVVNTYSYDPYGTATSVSEQVSNPFRYAGAIWDASTSLYKMGARYYDPSIGRFTQQDSAGGGYAYSGDDPINFSDTSGLRRKPVNRCGTTNIKEYWWGWQLHLSYCQVEYLNEVVFSLASAIGGAAASLGAFESLFGAVCPHCVAVGTFIASTAFGIWGQVAFWNAVCGRRGGGVYVDIIRGNVFGAGGGIVRPACGFTH